MDARIMALFFFIFTLWVGAGLLGAIVVSTVVYLFFYYEPSTEGVH